MPAFQAYPVRATQGASIEVKGYAEGADGVALSVIEGVGVSFTYVSEGLYVAVFPRPYAALVSWGFSLGADTPGDLKGYSVVLDVDSLAVANGQTTVRFTVYNASVTAADLIVNQFLGFSFTFRDTTRKTN